MLAALAVAACGAGPVSTRRPQGTTTGLARLDRAIQGFDATRAKVVAQTNAIVAAATALDAADAASALGDRPQASSARATARPAVAAARTALAGLPAALRDYRVRAAELAAASKASTSLSAPQRTAVGDVVTASGAEAEAADAFRLAGATAWPAYTDLDEAQALWLTRARSGWYRTTAESANAYAVLVQDQRPALTRARTLLRRVDQARRPVSERVSTALKAADTALTPLRSPELPGG